MSGRAYPVLFSVIALVAFILGWVFVVGPKVSGYFFVWKIVIAVIYFIVAASVVAAVAVISYYAKTKERVVPKPDSFTIDKAEEPEKEKL